MTFEEWWRNVWCRDDVDIYQTPTYVKDAMREAWNAAKANK